MISIDQPWLPSPPISVDRYLAYLVSEGKGPASANMALAAINAFHERAGMPSPTKDPSVRLTLKGISRSLGSVPRQAQPMTKKVLNAMAWPIVTDLRRVSNGTASLIDLRGLWFELTAFLTVSRFSDLQRVRRRDVLITDLSVQILLHTRKNDPDHAGHSIFLFKSHGEICPVRITKEYLKRLPSSLATPLLPQIDRGKALTTIASYNGLRSHQKKMLYRIGVDPSLYGLHSGRVGGAITLHDSGWNWDDIGAFGGWTVGSVMPGKYCRQAKGRRSHMSDSLAL